jgi:hypothetical protein
MTIEDYASSFEALVSSKKLDKAFEKSILDLLLGYQRLYAIAIAYCYPVKLPEITKEERGAKQENRDPSRKD